jgi:periplasmic protein TonB
MFEHSLIDLEARPSPRRRWLSLPIAVGLHVAGLTAFALASYWNVGSVQDPNVNIGPVTFFELPPPGGGGGQKPKAPTQEIKKQTVQQSPTKPTQPNADTVPDKPPAPAVNDLVHDLVTGPATGDPNPALDPGDGDCPGCPPGPGHGKSPVGPPGEPGGTIDTSPIYLSFGMTKPEIIHQVQPRYSELARRAAVQGAVIVEAVIDELGQVTHVRLIRGLPMQLDLAAMDAIKQWRFKPALLDGRPVKVFYTLTVNFTIQR